MIILGLTGSIGMGKSTTAQLFRDADVPVFDADAVVHELHRGEAAGAVEAAFPGVSRQGMVDRALLRARVLANPAAWTELETILHPLVAKRREAFLAEARRLNRPVVVLDIPLLFETGGEAKVDVVVLVSAPESVQKARVLARPGMTEAGFSAILARQVPDAEKRRRAHYIIDTGHGVQAARIRVAEILREIGGAAGNGLGQT